MALTCWQNKLHVFIGLLIQATVDTQLNCNIWVRLVSDTNYKYYKLKTTLLLCNKDCLWRIVFVFIYIVFCDEH